MADDKEFEKNKKKIQQRAIETGAIVEDALRSIADRIGDVIEESMGQVSSSTEKTVKSLERDLNSFANSASKVAAEIGVKASEGMLKTSDITKQMISNQKRIMSLQIKRNILSRDERVDLTDINKLLDDAAHYQNIITEELEAQLVVSKNISSAMGLTGNLLKTMASASKKIGISGLDEVFGNASMAAQQMAMQVTTVDGEIGKGNAGLSGKIAVLGAGMTELGKGILGLFSEPLLYIGLIVKAFTALKNLVFDFSKQTAEVARNFGISSEEAGKLNTNLQRAARSTSMLSGETRTAYIELNKAAGTFAQVSAENLSTYNRLTDALGLSKEAAQEFYKISVLQGRSLKDTVKDEFVRVASLREQSGLAVNVMEIMEGMSTASSATKLSLQGQGVALGQAAYQAKVLGIDLDKMDAIAGSLLDFESSIAAEMEAELLTGQQLNFEKARLFALNNDLAGVGRELEKQNITAEKFGGMNRIQQEAIAKSMGMSRDSMGDMLMQQELIRRGKAEEMGSAAETFEKNLKNYDLQQKFNRSIERLKEIFVTGIAPVIEKINTFLSNKSIDSLAKGGLALGAAGAAGLAGLAGMLLVRGSSPMTPMYTKPSGGGGSGGGIMDAFSSSSSGKIGKGGLRAPKGGMMVGSKFYKGGQFLPKGFMNANQGGGLLKGGKMLGRLGAGLGFGLGGLALSAGRGMLDDPNSGAGKALGIGSAAATGAGIGALLGVPGMIAGGAIGALYGATQEFSQDKKTGGLGNKLDSINQSLITLNKNTSQAGQVYIDGNPAGYALSINNYNLQ